MPKSRRRDHEGDIQPDHETKPSVIRQCVTFVINQRVRQQHHSTRSPGCCGDPQEIGPRPPACKFAGTMNCKRASQLVGLAIALKSRESFCVKWVLPPVDLG